MGKAIRDATRRDYVHIVIDREGGNYHVAKILFAQEQLDNLTNAQAVERHLSQIWSCTRLAAFLGGNAFVAVLIEN